MIFSLASILKHLSRGITCSTSVCNFAISVIFCTSAGSICVLPLLPGVICKRILVEAYSADSKKPLSTLISLYSSKVSKCPQELISFLSEILRSHRNKYSGGVRSYTVKNFNELWCL